MLKISLFLKHLQTSRVNNSRILRIKNAKFSGYCFYMNTNLYCDFQICISVPLKKKLSWEITDACFIRVLPLLVRGQSYYSSVFVLKICRMITKHIGSLIFFQELRNAEKFTFLTSSHVWQLHWFSCWFQNLSIIPWYYPNQFSSVSLFSRFPGFLAET